MRGAALEVRVIPLLAVTDGERAWLLDRHGRLLRSAVRVGDINSVADPSSALSLIWKRTAIRIANTLKARVVRATPSRLSPWLAKATVLAASFRQREREHARPRARCRFEVYKTSTWPMAAERMAYQVRNRFRMDQRSSWDRWAYTVANNQNKRARRRDAEEAECVAQTDSGVARKSAIPLCSERPGTVA
jgi:hypothetical protein